MRVFLILAATVLCILTPSVNVDSAPMQSADQSRVGAEEPSDGESFAITSEAEGNHDIYLFSSSGSKTRLTTHEAYDAFPTWSPDGKQLAFESNRDGNSEIYVMDADGTNVRRLTRDEADDLSPAWSPDGNTIAFASGRDHAFRTGPSGVKWMQDRIYLVDADGTNLRKLHDRGGGYPAWSPDGEKIAYVHRNSIWIVNSDGSEPRRITDDGGLDLHPSWSPNGKRIAFASSRAYHPSDLGRLEIYTIDPDGSHIRRLTSLRVQSQYPDWSSDGSKIVFYANLPLEDGELPRTTAEIYVMSADGSNLTRLTNNEVDDYAPVFRPVTRDAE